MIQLYHQNTRDYLIEGLEPDDYFQSIENLLLNNLTSIKDFYPINREINLSYDNNNINNNNVLIITPNPDISYSYILKLKYQETKINHDILMVATTLYGTNKHNSNLNIFFRDKIIKTSGLLNELNQNTQYKYYILDYSYENITFNVYNDNLVIKIVF